MDSAEVLFNQGKGLEAEVILRRLLEKAPEESAGHELLGQVLAWNADQCARRGDEDRAAALRREAADHAVRAAQTALETPIPSQAGLWQSAAVFLSSAGDLSGAADAFRRARALDEGDGRSALQLGLVLIALRNWDEALEALSIARRLNPGEPLAVIGLAQVAQAQGACNEARSLAEEACRLAAGDVNLRIVRAAIFRQCGEPAVALAQLRALGAVESLPQSVLPELARCAEETGDHALCAAARGRDAMMTTDVRARATLVAATTRAWHRAGREDEAMKWLARARPLLGAEDLERLRADLGLPPEPSP